MARARERSSSLAWRVGLGLLVAGAMADDAGDVVGAVAGPRNARDASGPALPVIQAEIGAVVRGVRAGDLDHLT